jgi:hypothetical protein
MKREPPSEDLMNQSFNAAIELCAKTVESMPFYPRSDIAKAIRSLLKPEGKRDDR